jgi:hypothetical protein
MAAGSSETAFIILRNRQRHIPEESNHHSHRREILETLGSKFFAVEFGGTIIHNGILFKVICCDKFRFSLCHTLKIIIICNPANSKCMLLSKYHVNAGGSGNWFISFHVFQFDNKP